VRGRSCIINESKQLDIVVSNVEPRDLIVAFPMCRFSLIFQLKDMKHLKNNAENLYVGVVGDCYMHRNETLVSSGCCKAFMVD